MNAETSINSGADWRDQIFEVFQTTTSSRSIMCPMPGIRG